MGLYDTIGQQIKKTRQEQGIGQKVLASVLGYTPSTISQYESGKRYLLLSDLEKIAITLNRPLIYFIAPGERKYKKKLSVSLKQYKMIHTANKLKRKLKNAEKEAEEQRREIKKLENKIQSLVMRIAEQSKITNQTALLYDELKRNEKKVREAEIIKSAYKSVKDMACKLNNPLTALLGFIQILISEIPTSLYCNSGSPSGRNYQIRFNLGKELKRLEIITERCIKTISELINSFENNL